MSISFIDSAKLLMVVVAVTNIIAKFSPRISASIAKFYWMRTKRYSVPQREIECLDKAKKDFVYINESRIAIYRWGNGPVVLLVHGWNGRVSQFAAFVQPLLDQGYCVLAFDAPGHGKSRGNSSSLIEVARIILYLHEREKGYLAIIGHSFGAVAATYAFQLGVKTKCFISIGAPASFPALLSAFFRQYRFNDEVKLALEMDLCKKYEISDLEYLSMKTIVKQFTFPALVVHGKSDVQVPLKSSEIIAESWQNSKKLFIDGGHSSILRKVFLVNNCIEFINDSMRAEAVFTN